MGAYYSPEGNYEIWDEKPAGYFTTEEWLELHPPEPPQPEPPGADYELINDQWVKVKYSKLEFLFWCGFDKQKEINAAIAAGNADLATIKDALSLADYIYIRDPKTILMVNLLATPEGGNILSPADVERILAGEPYDPE